MVIESCDSCESFAAVCRRWGVTVDELKRSMHLGKNSSRASADPVSREKLLEKIRAAEAIKV